LALSIDKVSWSRKPATWNIRPLIKKGVLIGLLLFAECITWFFAAKSMFGLTDPARFNSFGFACLFFSTIASIPVIRTEKRFYKEPISKTLLYVLLADIIAVCLMLAIGFTGFAKIPGLVIVSTLCFFIATNLLINDYVKTWLLKTTIND